MKAKAKFYKGIEYIIVSDLPADQQEMLDQKNVERIKILMDGKIVCNCISYQEYSNWFLTTFKQRAPVTKPVHADAITVPVHITFNKE